MILPLTNILKEVFQLAHVHMALVFIEAVGIRAKTETKPTVIIIAHTYVILQVIYLIYCKFRDGPPGAWLDCNHYV